MSETSERIEQEMFEIRSRMSPDINDLRKHIEPQVVAEQVKQTLRQRLLQAPTLPGPPQDLKRTSRVAEQFFVAPTAWVRPAAGCVKLASWDEATPHISFSGGPPIFPYPYCGRSYSQMRL